MSYHFNAGQFEKAFLPKRLGNWEVPHWYPRRPRAPEVRGPTVPLADINGRLLPKARRLNPGWGFRRTAWDYPNRITKELADELAKDPPPGRYVEWQPNTDRKQKETSPEEADDNREKVDDGDTLERPSENFGDRSEIPALPELAEEQPECEMENNGNVDPHTGFFYARKMHMDNLLHRPLPDALGTKESNMKQIPGRDLNVKPYSVANRILLENAAQRPATSNGCHFPSVSKYKPRPATTGGDQAKKGYAKPMTPMHLAICWDFRTANPRDEPKRPKHIDGSNGSMAPAVFAMIHSPKVDQKTMPDTGRSNAIFSQNVVPDDYENERIVPSFDKDMSKNKKKEACETPNCPQHSHHEKENKKRQNEKCTDGHGCGSAVGRSTTDPKHNTSPKTPIQNQNCRRNSLESCKITKSDENTNKKLSSERNKLCRSSPNINQAVKATKINNRPCVACDHGKDENDNIRGEYKMAFKAGKPNSMSSSEGKNGDSNSNSTKNSVKVPKMKNPYGKMSYTIPTLAPPFSRWHDTSGYPEHWRLASVYQHAYKTPDPKRRPLLPAVYQ